MNKFLIGVWGNPFYWNKVRYIYHNTSKESKSSLPLIREIEKPDKVIIICSDTIIDDLANFKNYNELKSNSKDIIELFSSEELNFKPNKVIVGYGRGEFKKTRFLGNASDFYYIVMAELIFALIENLNFNHKEIEVIFDITHGINFTTVLSHRAIMEILGILSYYFTRVYLKVLNSDPYRQDVKNLNINEIQELLIMPYLSVYKNYKVRMPVEPCNLEIEGKLKEIYIFLSSFVNSLPIFVFNYMPSNNELKNLIENLIECYESQIEIKNSDKIEIHRKAKFNLEFEVLLKAYLLTFLLNKAGFSKLDKIPISKIEKFTEVFYRRFPAHTYLIEREIEVLRSKNYE